MARDYTKIKAWQLADELALLIYGATKGLPKSEVWGLTSQMRRAAVSVPANIVEGAARRNRNEYLQFLYIDSYFITRGIKLLHQVYKGDWLPGYRYIRRATGKGTGKSTNTPRINFLY